MGQTVRTASGQHRGAPEYGLAFRTPQPARHHFAADGCSVAPTATDMRAGLSSNSLPALPNLLQADPGLRICR